MNKFLLIFLTMAFGFSAFADIPRPPRPKDLTEMKVIGVEATELSRKIDGSWMKGHSRNGAFCSYKIYRSSTGLTQIICQLWIGENAPQNVCSIQKSTNNAALPNFNSQTDLD